MQVNLDAVNINGVYPNAIADAAALVLRAMKAHQNPQTLAEACKSYTQALEKMGEGELIYQC